MCSKPFRQGVMEYGCGQCGPCRINRRRVWTSRLMLELLHSGGVGIFATLTYDDAHLPQSVEVRDLQLWMKRLRKAIAPAKVRYYGVGEYGDISGRPHYHILLFGLRGEFAAGKHEACDCVICGAWRKGMVFLGTVTPQSCAYVVSYVTKGMTRKSDTRLNGRKPEFARMSLRPGIGAGAADGALREAIMTKGGALHVVRSGDVPGRVRSEGKMWPLGRYLLNRLRTAYGMGADDRARANAKVAIELQNELSVKGARDLREQKRLQSARRAKVLNQIYRSKKGIGL